MRFGKFESKGLKPLTKTETKAMFKNPSNEGQIVSVLNERVPTYKMLEETEKKKTPRTLKGSFYLTKIAHLLRPDQVPNIHQIGETVDGEQTVDRDLKELVKIKRGEAAVADAELKQIGLGPAIDTKVNNYTRDEEGTVSYLDEFTPWQINTETRTIELHFDADEMRKAIDEFPDPIVQKECDDYLDRVLVLFEEEKVAFAALEQERFAAHEEIAKDLEVLFEEFGSKHSLEFLHSLQTEEEARSSPERKAAMADFRIICDRIRELSITYIGSEKFYELSAKLKKLAQATGSVSNGRVDHTR